MNYESYHGEFDDLDDYDYADYTQNEIHQLLSATWRAIKTLEQIAFSGGDNYETELAKATLKETGYYKEPQSPVLFL